MQRFESLVELERNPDIATLRLRPLRSCAGMLAAVVSAAGLISCSSVNAEPADDEQTSTESTSSQPTNAAPANDSVRCGKTAAAQFGWGNPDRSDEFADASSFDNWWLYKGVGHAGNGRRTPSAISIGDGAVTITADAQGNSGGMAAKGPGQRYGRWEVCAKSSVAAIAFHSVLLLWPDAEDWPVGGEMDFMEIDDPTRQKASATLHSGPEDRWETGFVPVDATQWHSWGVEWTPNRIAVFLDGVQWWQTTDTARFPPRPLHLCLQLDHFGGDTRGGATMTVDWAREYWIDE